MNYDFIEIGTSDFDSLIQEDNNNVGISIEPVKFLLDNLPEKDNVIKLNCAISDRDGDANIFWIHPKDVDSYDLPWWLKGCSSLYSPHPGMIRELKDRNLNFLLRMSLCPIVSWKTLVKNYSITNVDYLKIDTEGHDCIIVNNILDYGKIFPKKINFETNGLIEQTIVNKTIERLLTFNYKIIINNDWETTVELNT